MGSRMPKSVTIKGKKESIKKVKDMLKKKKKKKK